ncbi:DUF3667 domain-containing protein [Winogradskyella maritima]|uniref:DUF3667 domain-containing protein n=1 Tax=Winogradskyella maritima TaxID=1517766 RepID=A0ABV8ALW7_9FLAO|nr:DUF3667 domain-containing protein [Winogradskyella maritima]
MKCKNCQKDIIEESDYCNYCGARVVRNRLTIGNLISHFSEEFLNYDNRFIQTFKNLFVKPEDVIRSYIDGTRKKYVNVISYFAIAITISGLQLFLLQRFFPESLSFDSISQPGLEEFNKGVFNFVREYQSLAMMLNVPIYALISRIVFIRERQFKYNYTEHLVIFMYLLAQLSMVNVILTIIGAMFGFEMGEMSILFGPLQLLFSGYCLKRIFNLDWPNFMLRSLIFFGVLVVISIIFSIVFAIIAKQTGMLDAIIEAQKQAIEASKSGQ